MIKSGLTALTLVAALIVAPTVDRAFAGGDPPASPPTDTSTQKGKKPRHSLLEDPTSTAAYRTAYASIYERDDYAGAIDRLKSLGRDDNASVATLIGYSYRKLGDYKLAQAWYERALKADPDHVKTWQYYGLWQIEQGNRDQAQYHLSKIAQLAGTGSEEYRSLAAALAQPSGTGLVY